MIRAESKTCGKHLYGSGMFWWLYGILMGPLSGSFRNVTVEDRGEGCGKLYLGQLFTERDEILCFKKKNIRDF